MKCFVVAGCDILPAVEEILNDKDKFHRLTRPLDEDSNILQDLFHGSRCTNAENFSVFAEGLVGVRYSTEYCFDCLFCGKKFNNLNRMFSRCYTHTRCISLSTNSYPCCGTISASYDTFSGCTETAHYCNNFHIDYEDYDLVSYKAIDGSYCMVINVFFCLYMLSMNPFLAALGGGKAKTTLLFSSNGKVGNSTKHKQIRVDDNLALSDIKDSYYKLFFVIPL